MGEEPRTGGTPVSDDPEEIREQIEQTREELGETVEALAAKTDVKAQAKRKLNKTKATAAEKKDEFVGKARETSPQTVQAAATQATDAARRNPLPLAVAAGFGAGFLAGLLVGRR
jgi:ElaB/YqjD/DUF883 family membrane-anchored ribosome-binding protein